MSLISHPYTRIRRNKRYQWSRDLLTENHIRSEQLILPIFVAEGNSRVEIATMPGVEVLGIDLCVELVKYAYDQGIVAVALFPRIAPALKSSLAEHAWDSNNILCKAVAAIKRAVPGIGVITDIALDPYTSHGHDGLLDNQGFVDNDLTISALCKQATVLSEAGCDVLAPSDMMDGKVRAIRAMLDEKGMQHVQIYSYSAKYASSFYGPFREAVAAGNGNTGLNKMSYQLNPANTDDALRKIELDISEGADAVIIKPGLPYLDIIKEAKARYNIPIIAYQVSGEYAMLKFAAFAGALDYEKALWESVIAMKRAGSTAIITYAALEIAQYIAK